MSGNLSTKSAVIMLLCTMLGGGAIFMPKAFLCLYWPYTSILFIVCIFLTILTIFFLCMAAHSYDYTRMSYNELGSKIHPFIGHYINFSVVICTLICCVIYSRTIDECVSDYFLSNFPLWRKITFFILISLGTFLKNIRKLEKLGYLSVFSIFLLAAVVVFYYFSVPLGKIDKQNYDFPSSFSIIFFAMCCHQSVVNVYYHLQDKSRKNIIKISVIPVLLCGLIYATIGLCGAFIMGSDIKPEDILKMFKNPYFQQKLKDTVDSNGLGVKVASLFFSAMMGVSFSFQFHPARDIIVSSISNKKMSQRNLTVIRYLTTLLMLSTIFIIFISEIEIRFLLKMANAFGITGFSLVIPSIAFFYTRKNKKSLLSMASLVLAGLGIPVIFIFLYY